MYFKGKFSNAEMIAIQHIALYYLKLKKLDTGLNLNEPINLKLMFYFFGKSVCRFISNTNHLFTQQKK